MVQQSMRFKVLILPLSLVVAIVVVIFFIKPSFTDMMTAKRTLDENKGRLENLKSQTQKLQSVKAKWESLTDEKTLVASALPEAEDVDSYISELTAKASRSGILLSNIKAGEQNSAALSPAYICGSNPAGSMPQAGGAPAASDLAGLANSSNCLEKVSITLTALGSWEQMLDFLKYVEDMNRISNLEAVSLSSSNQPQNQPSDILTTDIGMTAFFKKKSQSGNTAPADNLASKQELNQKALDKLKDVVYSPYEAPAVSPSAERNIFK